LQYSGCPAGKVIKTKVYAIVSTGKDGNMENNVFVGMGHNPDGPDVPMGLGMQLCQDPDAMHTYGALSKAQQEAVIRYVQGSATGEDAHERIAKVIRSLREGRGDWS